MSQLKRIGGSTVAAIAGENPHCSPFQAWLRLTGQMPDQEGNEAMALGNDLEAPIASWYSKTKPALLSKGAEILHPTKEFVSGTPDFLALEDQRLVEVKTAGLVSPFFKGEEWGEAGTDQIPNNYRLQVQWYMQQGLTGLPVCDVAALIAGRGRLIFTIPADQELIGMLLTIAERFWVDHVLTGREPALEARDREDFRSWYGRRYPKSDATLRAATPQEVEWLEVYRKYRDARDASEERMKELELKLTGNLNGADGITSERGKFTYKLCKGSTQWKDVAGALKATPELAEKFRGPAYRRLFFSFKD